MSEWAEEDTQVLRWTCEDDHDDPGGCGGRLCRAAVEIRRLRARVAELEAARRQEPDTMTSATVPRADVVRALREVAKINAEDMRYHLRAGNVPLASRCEGAARVCEELANEAEAGEWPKRKGGGA